MLSLDFQLGFLARHSMHIGPLLSARSMFAITPEARHMHSSGEQGDGEAGSEIAFFFLIAGCWGGEPPRSGGEGRSPFRGSRTGRPEGPDRGGGSPRPCWGPLIAPFGGPLKGEAEGRGRSPGGCRAGGPKARGTAKRSSRRGRSPQEAAVFFSIFPRGTAFDAHVVPLRLNKD
jgi:hypothetical protein